jgi:hypothetical protein
MLNFDIKYMKSKWPFTPPSKSFHNPQDLYSRISLPDSRCKRCHRTRVLSTERAGKVGQCWPGIGSSAPRNPANKATN